jgi:DNA-binding SARP family transcriptional activator
VILMRKKQYNAAEKALADAIAMQPRALPIHLHLAEVYVLKGNKKGAIEIVEMLQPKRTSLGVADQLKLDELRKKIRRM